MEITSDITENEKHSSSVTLPLLSRIDRLEVAMRCLEMKQCSSSSGCSSTGANNSFSPTSGLTSEHQHHQKLPLSLDLEMALKEVTFKASLLERIKTLENRLFQLRLRVESDKVEARARRDQVSSVSCSFPIFTMSSQSNAGYKKHVEEPNAEMIINNNESQEKEQNDVTRDHEKVKRQSKKNKKKSKSENGDQEKNVRRMKKKKVTREAEAEKIKNPNWSHLRILGC